MFSHADYLANMHLLRAALIGRYKWFIHTTPVWNISGIRDKGLLPCKDATPPEDVQRKFGSPTVPILCLHPLGALSCPDGTKKVEDARQSAADPKLMSLAVEAINLPQALGFDWSNLRHIIDHELFINTARDYNELALYIINKLGSIAVYDTIHPQSLRIFCKGCAPANPLTWTQLVVAQDDQIFIHD